MATKKEKITSKAIEVLKSNLDGVRYSDLIRKIHEEFPEIPVNTIHGTIWNLDARVPAEVYKPARGLFRYVVAGDGENGEEEEKHPLEIEKIKEEDFYEPFADWLVNELEECTKAMPLGGNRFKDR